jgi:hypothetical protein
LRLDTKKRIWVIVSTALVLYGLSELSGYLKEQWFPTTTGIVISQNGTRGFRVSDQGQLQIAILKPIVEIKEAKLIDSRNHPNFHDQNHPYLYRIHFNFDVINGIENKQNLILNKVIAIFKINEDKSKIESSLEYHEKIPAEKSKNISTITEKPLFIGYSKKIRKCTLSIQCKFENLPDLISKEFEVAIR